MAKKGLSIDSDNYYLITMGLDRNISIQLISLLAILLLAVIPSEFNIVFIGFVSLFVIALIIYLNLNDKLNEITTLREDVKNTKNELHFIDRINGIEKRLSIFEIRSRKKGYVIAAEWLIMLIIIIFVILYFRSQGIIRI